ncbi:MAG: hypothetical protein JWM10_4048 [Myxococcaceae bacterium]|nr:hypothetical protein [Myxococcaceae bacterium]
MYTVAVPPGALLRRPATPFNVPRKKLPMSTSLQSALAQVSEEFAQKVFGLIRTAFVAELSNVTLSGGAPAPAARARAAAAPKALPAKATKAKSSAVAAPKAAAKSGRLERRSSESIAKALDGIAALLVKKPGIGSEEIQKTLGLARNEIARPIAIGIGNGTLTKVGEKRATKYYAGNGAKSAAGAAKKPAKKAAAAAAKPAKKAGKPAKSAKSAKKAAAKSAPEAAAPAAS